MKAMILAAGRGERMRHLTLRTPKPLLKVQGKSLLEHNIERLRDSGVKDIVINVCYRAKQIIRKIGDGSRLGVRVQYSHEEEGPHGTGGGIRKALPLLGDEPFVVVSGDVWTDYPFDFLKDKLKGDAHLVMVENPEFHPKGDYRLIEKGLLEKGEPRLTYASIAILHPRLFSNCKSDSFSLAPVLEEAMKNRRVTGELYDGDWYNVGTPQILQGLRKKLRG